MTKRRSDSPRKRRRETKRGESSVSTTRARRKTTGQVHEKRTRARIPSAAKQKTHAGWRVGKARGQATRRALENGVPTWGGGDKSGRPSDPRSSFPAWLKSLRWYLFQTIPLDSGIKKVDSGSRGRGKSNRLLVTIGSDSSCLEEDIGGYGGIGPK